MPPGPYFPSLPGFGAAPPVAPSGGGALPGVPDRLLANVDLSKINPPQQASGPPSLWDQASNLMGGVVPGLIGFGQQIGEQSANQLNFLGSIGSDLKAGQVPDVQGAIDQYMPVTQGFEQQYKELGSDVLHPTQYLQASQQGTILPKIVNDAAALSILAGPAAKAFTAAAGPTAEAAEAATQASRIAAAGEGGAESVAPVAEGAARAPLLSSLQASPGALAPEDVAHPALLRVAQGIENAASPLEKIGFAPAKTLTAPLKLVTGFDLPFLSRTVDVPGETPAPEPVPEPATVGAPGEAAPPPEPAPVAPPQPAPMVQQQVPYHVPGLADLAQRSGLTDAFNNLPPVQKLEDRYSAWRQNQNLLNQARETGIYPQNSEFSNSLLRAGKLIQSGARLLGGDPELEHAATMIRSIGPLGEVPGQFRQSLEDAAGGQLSPEQVDAYAKDFTSRTFGETQAPTPRTQQIVADYMNGTLDDATRQKIEAANARVRVPFQELQAEKLNPQVDSQGRPVSGMALRAMSPEQLGTTAMESKVREGLTGPAADVTAAQQAVDEARARLVPPLESTLPFGAQEPLIRPPSGGWEPAVTMPPAEGEPYSRVERASKDAAMKAIRDQAQEHVGYAAQRVSDLIGGDRIGAGMADIEAQAGTPLQPWEKRLISERILQRAPTKAERDLGLAAEQRGSTPDQWAQNLSNESTRGTSGQMGEVTPAQAVNELVNRLADEKAASMLARGRQVPPELLARYTGDLSDHQYDLASTAGEERLQMHRDALRAEAENQQPRMLPELTDQPRPWTLKPDEYKAELGNVQATLAEAAGSTNLTAAQQAALHRLQELVPESIRDVAPQGAGSLFEPITADEAYARVRASAQAFGEDVHQPEPSPILKVPDEARQALTDAQARLDEANRKYAETEARLQAGPKETAPGRYFPILSGMERARSAWNDIADQVDKAAPGAGAALKADMPEIADTIQKLQQLHPDFNPEYVPGVPTKTAGVRKVSSGSKEQLPYTGKAPGQRQKTFGTVPRTFRDQQIGYANDLRAITRNKGAAALQDAMGRTVEDVLREAHANGELLGTHGAPLSDQEFEAMLAGKQGPDALAAALDRSGYASWNPNSPITSIAPRSIGPDTVVLPKPVVEAFQRWWSPKGNNPIVRGYDWVTRGYKHNVLALSPMWQVRHVLGDAFMSTFGAGLSPAGVVRGMKQAMDLRKIEQETGESPIPARVRGANQAAEVMRDMAEHTVPRTVLGRTIGRSYGVMQTVSDLFHSAVYLAKREKGYDEATAVALANRAMGDFSRMTPFERDVVRRVVPFYSWARHVTQATAHLAIDHPYRTAWLMNLGQIYGPGQNPNVPDYLAGATKLPWANWFVNAGTVNPYDGSVGSIFSAPSDWPTQIGKSMNPVIKLGAAGLAGWDLSKMKPITRPPGTGNLTAYGAQTSTPLLQSPAEFAQFASRLAPAGRLFHDVADTRFFTQPSYVNYDTGDVEKFRGRPRVQPGGTLSQLAQFGSDLGLPFVPSYLDEQQAAQEIAKGQRSAALTARRYFGP